MSHYQLGPTCCAEVQQQSEAAAVLAVLLASFLWRWEAVTAQHSNSSSSNSSTCHQLHAPYCVGCHRDWQIGFPELKKF